MKNLTANSVFKFIKEYFLMALGCSLYAFAWECIISPAGIIGGGASGLSLIIEKATGLDMGIGFFIINAILITLAVITIGARFGVKTIYCILTISFFLQAFRGIIPTDSPFYLFGLDPENDRLLATILGAVIAGGGVSLSFHEGGSTGGTDIVWMLINHFKTVSYGRVLMMVDFCIISGSYFVYGDIRPLIYGFVMVAVFGYTVDMIMAGNKQSSQIFVFSKQYQEIANRITKDLHRGVTIFDGIGAYTGQSSKMLVIVCRKFETETILKVVKECDPKAFLSIGAVMGVYGEGFENLPAVKQAAIKRKQAKLEEKNNEQTV